MNLYCPKCQNLIEKIDETMNDGKELDRMCQRCAKKTVFVVKYRATATKDKTQFDKNGK